MRDTRWSVAVMAVLLIAISCGDDPSTGRAAGGDAGRSPELEDALGQVRTTLDELIEEVVPKAETSPRDDNEQAIACDDGEVRSSFGYVIDIGKDEPLATLHLIHAFFASREFDVDIGSLEAEPPSLVADGDGFSYSATAARGGITLDGTTPCFPEA